MLNRFDRIFKKIDKGICSIIGIMLFTLVAVSTAAVFSRFVLGRALFWSDEFLRYLFIWLIFFTIPILVIEKGHIVVDLVSLFASENKIHIANKICYVSMILFFIVLFRQSFEIIRFGMGQISASMQIPMGFVYMCIPFSAFMIIVNYTRLLITEFKK